MRVCYYFTMLHFEELGQGEPLIILHGFLGSGQNWKSIAQQFSTKYNVFLLDLRNHGWSPHSDDCGYEAMANDVIEFITTYNLYEPTLLGHSMGGKVAMQVSSQLREQIKQLIVVDIAPKAYENRHGFILDALYKLSIQDANALNELDKALTPDIPDKGLRGFLLKNLERESGTFKWKLNLPVLRDNVDSITAAPTIEPCIDIPTLFIKGQYSDYIKLPDDEQLIATYFDNYDINTIQKTGHWVHAMAPQAFMSTVNEFLTRY